MIKWRDGKGGFVGAAKQAIKGFFSYSFTVTTVANGSVVLTGTAITELLESDVITGSKTIIATISDDTWLSTLGADNAATTAWLNGLTSDRNGSGEWDTRVRDNLVYTDLTRNSDTVATLVLPASIYEPEGNETITLTVDVSTMTSTAADVTASPTISITITPVAPIGRTVLAEPETREITAEPETRVIVIEAENRTIN